MPPGPCASARGAGRMLRACLHAGTSSGTARRSAPAAAGAGASWRASRSSCPSSCPDCGQAVIAACPACGEGITSLMQITCSGCGEALRDTEFFGRPIRRKPERHARRRAPQCAGEAAAASRGVAAARAALVSERGADLGEVDHGHRVLVRDVAVVELPEEDHELVERAQLGVVVLQLARRDVAEALDLDLVDDRVEDVRARAEALAAEHLEAEALAVLRALVAETDRDRLAPAAQLIGDQRVVEVERLHRAECTGARSSGRVRRPRARVREAARA